MNMAAGAHRKLIQIIVLEVKVITESNNYIEQVHAEAIVPSPSPLSGD